MSKYKEKSPFEVFMSRAENERESALSSLYGTTLDVFVSESRRLTRKPEFESLLYELSDRLNTEIYYRVNPPMMRRILGIHLPGSDIRMGKYGIEKCFEEFLSEFSTLFLSVPFESDFQFRKMLGMQVRRVCETLERAQRNYLRTGQSGILVDPHRGNGNYVLSDDDEEEVEDDPENEKDGDE